MKITTYTGRRELRKNCKRIKDSYYFVGNPRIKDSGECYFIEGRYHRFNNKYIEYDHEAGEYVLIHKNTLREGIIDYDVNKKKWIKGMFSPNISKNVKVFLSPDKNGLCISESIAKKGNYRERLSDGMFFERSIENSNWFNKINKAPVNKSGLQYESRFVSKLTEREYSKNFIPKNDNDNINILGNFLEKNGITFGLEFETTKGYIPDRLCYKYGLIPLRDGSIQGLEYVTIPLAGKKGLYALREICKELKKRTKYDYKCALHLHIAGLSRKEDSILSSFILGCLIQEEQFLMQPQYKKGGTGVQGKDYCKPLPTDNIFGKLPDRIGKSDIKKWFSKLFYFVSDGKKYSDYKSVLTNIETHPSDPSGNRKWEIRSRYFYLNFVPILFGNKKTVEFRHHNITYDFDKIINFIIGCMLFIWTAENCKDQLFDDKSELFSKLIKKPNRSMETLAGNFVKRNTGFVDIISHFNRYCDMRKRVMLDLTKIGDTMGKKETAFDSEHYGNLFKNFWS